jgi:DNA-binding protein HU-beta
MELTEEQTEIYVRQFVDVFVKEISAGKVVSVQGFGNFESKEKTARKMYNPSTKSFKIIPKKVVLNFKMSGALKEKINN